MKFLEKGIRDLLNRRQANRETLIKRTENLNHVAEETYRIPTIIANVMVNDVGLKPHQGYSQHSSGQVDISYEVTKGNDVRGFGKKRQPLFRSSAVEIQDGEFYDVPDESYTSHRIKRFRLFSLELMEDGEFHLRVPYERPVRLGTTALIRSHEDLLIAVKDQIKRKRPMV